MGKAKNTPARLAPAQQAKQAAESAQQRGERRAGQDATRCFQEAVNSFRQALQGGLPENEKIECLFGLAECLQQLAERVVADTEALPDSLLTQEGEAQALAQAGHLLMESVSFYRQVTEGGCMRVDACVNCGNALAELGELCQKVPSSSPQQQQQQQCTLYTQACAMYDAALQQENDALTHSNKADLLIQMSQAAWDAGVHAEAQVAYQSALAAYEESCSLSSSSDGDDLPGLLANWGTGLIAASKVVSDVTQQGQLLEAAVVRLRHCADFARGDPSPLVSLGDAFIAKAELCAKQVLDPGSSDPGPAPSLPQLLEAAGLLRQALAEGYERALLLNRDTIEATLGCAEAHTGLARLAMAGGDPATASQSLAQAVAAFEHALQKPEKIGGFKDRADARYNAACTLALAGRDAEACCLVRQLLACGGVQKADLVNDPDLKIRAWVLELLAQEEPVLCS